MEFIFSFMLLAFVAWREYCFSRERKELIEKLTKREQDFLDRLMAKDLPEVKQAQKLPDGGRVISKYKNNVRIAEEARKTAEQ